MIRFALLLIAMMMMMGCAEPQTEKIARAAADLDIQGHRGARGLAPENTVPSFLLALDYGVTTLELDVAVSADGQPQGSMGIAAGDFDRNGRPDLFVTNYYSEANNLYRMVTDGLFADEASSPLLKPTRLQSKETPPKGTANSIRVPCAAA